jgi:hypothetical protein
MTLLCGSNRFSMTNDEESSRHGRHNVRIRSASPVVAIESVTEQELTVSGLDVVDGTPLLDIKPFVPEFDIPSEVQTGWLDASESTIRSEQSDERFL